MPPARASSATHLNAGAFRFGEVLGRGTFGVVYKVVSRRDNTEAVIKQINLGRLSRNERDEASNEVALLSSLGHPHIIRYDGNYVDGKGLNIVMEFAARGDLHGKLKACVARGVRLGEEQVWKYSLQLMSALEYIHARKILHRDIKAMNVMLDQRGDVKVRQPARSPARTAAAIPQHCSG
jgi:NIMA (never in mitosis gene a)-related kinase